MTGIRPPPAARSPPGITRSLLLVFITLNLLPADAGEGETTALHSVLRPCHPPVVPSLGLWPRCPQGINMGIAIHGAGQPVGSRWFFVNAALRWIIQWPQGPIASCAADLHYGMPRLLFRSFLSERSALAEEWETVRASIGRSLPTHIHTPPEKWFPHACLWGRPTPSRRVLHLSPDRTNRPDLRQVGIVLTSYRDLILLPAAYVALACMFVRPVALLWDMAPTRRYFDCHYGMFASPPVFAPFRSGRWRLPGQVDIDTRATTPHLKASSLVVA